MGIAMKDSKVVLLTLFLVLTVSQAFAQGAPDALETLNGRWTWVGNIEKYGKAKACAEHWEEYKVSADRREIANSYMSDKSGTLMPQPGRGYVVVYRNGNTAALYLNNEDRKYKNGDRLIWVLQVENPNLFYWRILTLTLEQSEGPKFARARCPIS